LRATRRRPRLRWGVRGCDSPRRAIAADRGRGSPGCRRACAPASRGGRTPRRRWREDARGRDWQVQGST